MDTAGRALKAARYEKQQGNTHPIPTERGHVIVVAGVPEFDSVLASFRLATESALSADGKTCSFK